ncbi:MAG: phytanoyl-CoA dioxygenase family protein [Candidatus Eremiobacteraeota bacterium]|nr:phytanoyl-CoA dioxygenase family protein [Candidatus Eremiobacteraeota bacterium]
MRRLFERVPALAELLRPLLVPDMELCRSILFDKTPLSNWKVGWHQDVTLACPVRFERAGWTNWTVKDGVPHVQPPVAVLEQMVTVRLHLDDCGADNGPLRVVPGSHRLGRLSAEEIQARVATSEAVECVCRAGEVLRMRPLLVHSSGSATRPGRRRVVHLEFCPLGVR